MLKKKRTKDDNVSDPEICRDIKRSCVKSPALDVDRWGWWWEEPKVYLWDVFEKKTYILLEKLPFSKVVNSFMLVGKGMLISFLPKAVCHKLWRDMATATDALWSLSKISYWCQLFPCLKGSCQKWKTPFKTTPSWAGWHAMHEKELRRWTFAFIGKQQTGANCGGRSWKQSSDDEPLLVSQFREAPFKLMSPLCGHCPNSNYTPPALKRSLWGTFFQARFYHFTVFTILFTIFSE